MNELLQKVVSGSETAFPRQQFDGRVAALQDVERHTPGLDRNVGR
jgi:hypothetical protein